MQTSKIWITGLLVLITIASLQYSFTIAQDSQDQENGVGNVIFIHPDGTGLNHWNAARMYWEGPDDFLEWDKLPEMAVYRGHMTDRLTATSNGGATTHAFGYKVQGPGSFGQDAERSILALSGYPGSIMREAANTGHPVGVVNDGDLPEPGTGAFLAEVAGREDAPEIARQILEGRPGFDDTAPVVALGGGESSFLPQGTSPCENVITPGCAVHLDPVTGDGPRRQDGRNLIQEALDEGWEVLRTRAEFDAFRAKLESDSQWKPRVLGLFAADDIFNDVTEEALIRQGLVDPSVPTDTKRSNLILWGSKPGTLGFNPPTADEMTEVALTILERHSQEADKPFLLVTEVESTDNFGNSDNAIGTLRGLEYADGVIGTARAFQERVPETFIVTAADSDAGGMQVLSPPPVDDEGNVTTVNGNPTGQESEDVPFPVDGLYGRFSQPFIAATDAYSQELPFAIAWIGTPDVAGGILSRAQGLNAELLRERFSDRFDNTDIYRMMYVTLFGELLPSAVGKMAPDRETPYPSPTYTTSPASTVTATSVTRPTSTPRPTRTPRPETRSILERYAVLPAATFAEGPPSGTLLGAAPINGQELPFPGQPVQGFSAIIDNNDGTYWAMSDNGFGSIENSADYHLRLYHIRPDFETRTGGEGTIDILEFIELRDPDRHIPFAITNFFTEERILTGADFDIESVQRAPDGTLWIGDEFGPFLLHVDATGKLLEAPIPLPDFEDPENRLLCAPQNPLTEEASAIRVMNAVRAHARANRSTLTPVFAPWFNLLDDGDPATVAATRANPPAGLEAASSELFNINSNVGLRANNIKSAGFPVVVWTVNDKATMLDLMELGVDGIISDRPDLLLEAVREFDADNNGQPGDYLTDEGLIDRDQFDAQGHRGGRSLRPENTLPAMEVALDNLMTTLELDLGITRDDVPVLEHDPGIQPTKCRLDDGSPYESAVLIKNRTADEIQEQFICDKLLPDRPAQRNDRDLSPVAVAFAAEEGLIDPYVLPTLQNVLDFVDFYAAYYSEGEGKDEPGAALRAKNARQVRYNIETKINPREEFAARTVGPEPFARAVAGVVSANDLEDRIDIQSFDFRTLLVVQKEYPEIRTVFLFGDFPIESPDEGTNLQPDDSGNTPWLAGLPWPYRENAADVCSSGQFRVPTSGGFEGMALTTDGDYLLPLLERPLQGSPDTSLLIHEFSLDNKRYTGMRYLYPLNPRGTNIGDFVMFNAEEGLVIERDGSQGDLAGFKMIYKIQLKRPGEAVRKTRLVDLLRIRDPRRLSTPGQPSDVGIGTNFAFPFVTIESIFVDDRLHIGVLNDNNFPFSIGRHVGTEQPDDTEFIFLRLDKPLDIER